MTPSTEVLMDLRERMVRIETKLDTQAVTNQTIQEDVEDHRNRIGKLESNQKVIAGCGSLLIFLATFFHDPLVRLFH